MNISPISPLSLYQFSHAYKQAQVFFTALRLDIFSHLTTFTAPEELSKQTGYHPRNLSLFLNALAAMQILEKKDAQYRNSSLAAQYLDRASESYLGEYLLYRQDMNRLDRIEDHVRQGSLNFIRQDNLDHQVYNFRKLASLAAVEMRLGRLPAFLQTMDRLFPRDVHLRILDLGGGSGMMAIKFLHQFPNADGVIFEHPTVADIPEQFVQQYHLQQRLSVWQGDFTVDSIGEKYDLIIASGILDFAGSDLNGMANKLASALKPSGFLYLVAHNLNEDRTAPEELVLSWLSGQLAGLNTCRTRKELSAALTQAGFTSGPLTPTPIPFAPTLMSEIFQIKQPDRISD